MRPLKKGIDYFPFNVDFFEDEKMVCVAGEFGIKAEIVAVKLLCAIYREGYFIEWNEAAKFKLLRQVPGISSELLDQILNRLLKWGFFDVSLFESVKVLTSVGIQRRYFEIVKRRKNCGDWPYILVNVDNNPVNVDNNPVNVDNNSQSKVKKRKYRVVANYTREEFLEDFFSDERKSIIESLCMTNRTDEATLRRLAKEVLIEWEATSEPLHKDLNDAQRHLLSQIRVKLNIERRESQTNKPKYNEANQADKFSSRRGTEPSVKSRKDFKTTF